MKKVVVEKFQTGSNEFLVRFVSDKGKERYIMLTYWAEDRGSKNNFNMMTNVFAVAK